MSIHSDDSEMQTPYQNEIIEKAIEFIEAWTKAAEVVPHQRDDV
jgi:hypothetical protein